MLKQTVTREELYDLQGQLYMIRIVENLPNEIEAELQKLLKREEMQRELKETTSARTGI